MTDGLTLYVDDYDDEGTRYDLIGRGLPVSSYCVLTIRAAILARLTPDERERVGLTVAPEHLVTRVVADRGEVGDPDYEREPGVIERLPWVA